MNHRAVAEQLIASLGSVLSLPDLKLDDVSQSCVLLFDQDIVLNIELDDAGGQLIVSSYLDELSDDDPARMLHELMVANLYWHRTDGATIGLEDATNGLILADRRPLATLDDSNFEKWVESFVNQVERWKKRIAEIKAGIPEESATAMAPAHPMAGKDGAALFG